jgi:hypothetical protein
LRLELKIDQGTQERIFMNREMPKIFTLISCPIIGQLGPDTEFVEHDPCEACGMAYPEEIKFLDYQFDVWEQAELIKAGQNTYAITRRLWEALVTAGLRGFSTRPLKVSRGPILANIDPENKTVIPEFLELLILGKADGPSGWWDRDGLCRKCGRIIWIPTSRITDALFAKYSNEAGPPRLVSAATWHGDDGFFLSDPGPPIVTERFKYFGQEQKIQGLVLDHAQWVD